MIGDLREDGQAPTRRRKQSERAAWARQVERQHIYGGKGTQTLRDLARVPFLYDDKLEAKRDRRRLNRRARKRNAMQLAMASQWSGE